MRTVNVLDATLIVNIFTVSFARMSQVLSIVRSYVSRNVSFLYFSLQYLPQNFLKSWSFSSEINNLYVLRNNYLLLTSSLFTHLAGKYSIFMKHL